MSDTTFRTEQPAPEPEVVPAPPPPVSVSTSTVEVPYLDYPREHGQSFVVDHYNLGNTWSSTNDGGFVREINAIEGYMKSQIESGVIENSVEAVKNRLKEIEKVTNVSKEGRPAYKLGTIAAYVKFLGETDNIKNKNKPYGSK